MKKILFFVCLWLTTVSLWAQQNNNWLFDSTSDGIRFSPFGLIQFPTVSMTPVANIPQYLEGCASVSDQNGNLLLFSDGVRLWRAGNPTPITNQLRGNHSSTQNVIFIPRPGSPSVYYIVTIDGGTGGWLGLHYSEYNVATSTMVTLNTPLSTKAFLDGFGNIHPSRKVDALYMNESQAITSTVASNGTDYWLIAHVQEAGTTDGYLLTFRVNCNGIGTAGSGTRIATEILPVSLPSNSLAQTLKISPNGARIACNSQSALYLGGFNATTGIISGIADITNPGFFVGYGAEFSPNSNVLYYSDGTYNILARDLLTSSVSTVTTSGEEVGLQLGPDGRIYCTNGMGGGGDITAITNPNSFSSPSYDGNPITYTVAYGMPQWVHRQSNISSAIQARNDVFNFTSSGTSTNTVLAANPTNPDTFNGVAIPNFTGYTLSVVGAVTPTPSSGSIVLNTAVGANQGKVTVGAGTPCGTYVIKYQLSNGCAQSNEATVTITVGNGTTVPLTVVKEGLCITQGTTSTVSILTNDTFSGGAANASNVVINVVLSTLPAGVTVNPNGTLTVPAGTPAGNYDFTYQICNRCNLSNCSVTVGNTVKIYSANVLAVDDTVYSDNTGAILGGSYNVLTNDQFLCAPVNPANVTISYVPNASFSINTTPGANFGLVTVNSGLAVGNYSTTYTICETLNPSSCSTATLTVSVGITLGSRANDVVRTSSMYGANKVIISGEFSSYNGTSTGNLAMLNNNNLTLDTSFGTGISGFGPSLASGALGYYLIKAVLVDGSNVFVAGDFTKFNNVAKNRIVKLDATGAIVPAFTGSRGGTIHALAKQGSNLIVTGTFKYSLPSGQKKNNITRLDATTGATEITFLSGGSGADGAITAVAVLSDNTMIIGGDFQTYNGVTVNGIAKLDANGNLDPTFNVGGAGLDVGLAGGDRVVEQILVRGTSIYLVGMFNSYNGTAVGSIVKLTSSGALDMSFNNGTAGAVGTLYTISSESGSSDLGTLIIGGDMSHYNGASLSIPPYSTPHLVRINNNGTMNTTISGNKNINGRVRTTLVQSDGKIIIGGEFTSVNSIAAGRITRLNPTSGIQQRSAEPDVIRQADQAGIVISPNPGSGIFNLMFDKAVGEGTISVYNTLGQKMAEKTVSNVDSYDLDLSHLANGTYLVRIVGSEKPIVKTLIKK